MLSSRSAIGLPVILYSTLAPVLELDPESFGTHAAYMAARMQGVKMFPEYDSKPKFVHSLIEC